MIGVKNPRKTCDLRSVKRASWHKAINRCRRKRAPLLACVPRCKTRRVARSSDPLPGGCEPIRRARRSPCGDQSLRLPDTPSGPLRPGLASSRFPHDPGQHPNFPLVKASLDFQPRSPSKSKPITALLCKGRSLNLHKARFSPRRPPLSQPSLKIKQTHSLATAKFHTCQPALLIEPDNACLLLRAQAPTRPPGLLVFSLHARDHPTSRLPRIVGVAYCCLRLPTVAYADTHPPTRLALAPATPAANLQDRSQKCVDNLRLLNRGSTERKPSERQKNALG